MLTHDCLKYLLFFLKANLTQYGITQSSSLSNDTVKGKPENAVYPPISNQYSLDNCSSTGLAVSGISATWWLFKFSLDAAYITDILIYYREDCEYYLSISNTNTMKKFVFHYSYYT